ncbi:Clp protease N-terminal domain-containing protein [Actinomadura sp. 21ATH]|uniref:Clp protease N-terminal domain-containing protein n=1 Tax=Actinomadura sp. 21ATH TaxID=1735444 RepID=UPI0035BED2BC
MPKINVYLPDELAEAVKEAGVPVSAVCQRALEQAVRRVTAIRETASSGSDLQEAVANLRHFTERTRTAVTLAHEQARTSGAAEIGTEHLLGGLLSEGGNLALQVLRALEIDPDRVWSEIVRRTPAGAKVEDDPALRFGPRAAAALELTVTEATSLGHNYVGCEHLLLGLIAEPDGTAGRILRSMGAEPRLARRAVSAALAGYVHLRAQAAARPAAAPGDPQEALAAALRQELAPIVQRLERLEERLTDG